MRSITQSDDLEALSDLLQRHASHINVRHLDAALDRIGRLVNATGELVRSKRSPRKVRTTGIGRLPNPSPVAHAATNPAAAAAKATAGRLLASVLPANAATLSPRDCASILASLARLDLVPEPHLAELLQGALLAQLPRSSVRDRAALLHASVRLGHALAPAAVSEVLRSLDGGVLARSGKPQDVSMVLWSLATLVAPPAPSEPPDTLEPVRPGDRPPARTAAWLRRLLADLPPGRLAAFQPQALANTAWALARLGFRPEAEWLAGLVEASRPMLQAFQTRELCSLLWALAVLRYRPPAPWLVGMMARLREAASSMAAQDVANVCWSLSTLGVRPGLGLVQRLVARALAVRRDLTPQGLITTLWGLSRLRVQLPERAVALLLQGGLGAAALAAGPGPPPPPGATELSLERPGSESEPCGEGERAPGPGARDAGGTGTAAAGRRERSGHKGQPTRRQEALGGDEAPSSGRRGGSSAMGGDGRGGGGHRPAGPGDLAGAVLVLARCRYVPPRRWLARYYAAVARQLHGFGPRDMATLLYGLAELRPLGLRPEPRWMDLLLAEVSRLAGATAAQPQAQPQHLMKAPLQAAQRAQPVRLLAPPPPAALSGIPLARVASPPAERLAVTWLLAPSEPPPLAPCCMEPPGAAGSSSDRVGSQGADPRVGGSVGSAGLGAGGQLQPAQLAVVLWAVARLQHQPTEAWVEGMAACVAARVEDFGPSQAATAIRALQLLSPAAAARSALHSPPRPRRGRPWHPALASGGGGGSGGGGSGASCSAALVSRLVARMAGCLPERSPYRTLQTVSQSTGGVRSFACGADQLLVEEYSLRSLGLLRGGQQGAAERGQMHPAQ